MRLGATETAHYWWIWEVLGAGWLPTPGVSHDARDHRASGGRDWAATQPRRGAPVGGMTAIQRPPLHDFLISLFFVDFLGRFLVVLFHAW